MLPLTAAAAWLAAAVTSPAQDALRWNSTTSGEWTGPVWYDTTTGTQVVGNSGTANFNFLGNTANGTVAPSTMSINNTVSAASITFVDGFNPTNTATIASSLTTNSAPQLYLTGTTWAINDQASSGTITFNTAYNNQYGLYLGLNNTGTVTVASAGASLTLNTALTDYGTAGGITKAGAGSLTLGSSNSYTGGTTVNAGTVIVTGTASSGLGLGYGGSGSGAVTVNSGGTLAGTGTVYGATTVNAGGTLAPGTGGNTIGSLAIGNTALTSGGLTLAGAYRVDLNAPTSGTATTAGVNSDAVFVTGRLTLNATSSTLLIGSVANPSSLRIGEQFYVALNDGVDPVVGTFSNVNALAPTVTDANGDVYTVSYTANGDGGTLGNDISLTVTSVVPEPSATALVTLAGLAGVGCGFVRSRRRHAGKSTHQPA